MPKKAPPTTITIVIDRREGEPWDFLTVPTNGKDRPKVLRKKTTLRTGDYTLPRQFHRLALERKSALDLARSCTTDHARFKREHQRLATILKDGGFACVIIEDTLSHVCEIAENIKPGNANRVLGTLSSWAIAYHVPWYFTRNRAEAQRLAYDLLLKYQAGRKPIKKRTAK